MARKTGSCTSGRRTAARTMREGMFLFVGQTYGTILFFSRMTKESEPLRILIEGIFSSGERLVLRSDIGSLARLGAKPFERDISVKFIPDPCSAACDAPFSVSTAPRQARALVRRISACQKNRRVF